jgi:hypothetical protein
VTWRKKKVTAKLVGGLGNQLFIYFAALSLSKKIGSELRIDFSFIEKSHSEGFSRLDSFKLHGKLIESKGLIKKSKELRERVFDALSVRGVKVFSRHYVDDITIEEVRKKTQHKSYYLRGFHSTTKNYEALGRPELHLSEPSSEYSKLKYQIRDSVALHLRGGDYANFQDTFGPLSASYYLSALEADEEIRTIAREKTIYIFSDDQLRSSRLKEFLMSKGYNAIEVSFLYKLMPAEEMLLISSARAILTANSTFSFWASEISQRDTIVISPENFTRNGGTVDFESSRKRTLIRSEWE